MTKDTLSTIAADSSEIEHDFRCAADLALCLSMALEAGDIPGNVAGNALFGLYNYLSGLCDRQQGQVDSVYNIMKREAGRG
ncbi:MAG: hypothetical protein LIO51_09120 [Clostridiales bacterium]|nr:hypothetical protein [Clostridiales bacterium]